MKGTILRVVYSSTSENRAAECVTNVLIINYTKFTIQICKGDTLMSFNDEDWKGLTSNLGPSDIVEIFVVFGHGLIVKETTVYLIYDQSNTTKFEQSIIMEVEPSTNLEMEPSDKVNMQPSPDVNMQPSPNVKVEASTGVKTNLSPEVKVQSPPSMKMKPSQKLNKSVFTRLAKSLGTCLCLIPA
ncbi:unnamed protein product [Trifolium pratense]|uniref:Uncharacterized protein n=1 Tax=Trifolium pratense TaxID=57577 RepID=A0ACB0IR64_TRIPR|nr:unnamed protein product [Trifolium pratense]